jgi:hypothetical protein
MERISEPKEQRIDHHRDAPAMIYLWILVRPCAEPKTGLGSPTRLKKWLGDERLPGTAPAEWVVDVLADERSKDHFKYVHDEGGPDEWTVTMAVAGS